MGGIAMAEIVHSRPSDSKGYTHYTLDEPLGETQAGVRLVGPKQKLAEPFRKLQADGTVVLQEEMDYELVLHGQREFDVPSSIKSLKLDDGSSLKLSKG
jgi:hypothetical protein